MNYLIFFLLLGTLIFMVYETITLILHIIKKRRIKKLEQLKKQEIGDCQFDNDSESPRI